MSATGAGPRPDARTALGLFVDLAILAPIGVGTVLVEEAPKLIERGRKELVLARFVGKMAVSFGVAELRRQLTADREEHASDHAPVIGSAPAHRSSGQAPSRLGASAPAVDVTTLVLPDYDHLPAAHIVAKLASLDRSERDAVEAYERQNRHRRTILGKLDQLRAT